MPESMTGARSGNSATSDRLPPHRLDGLAQRRKQQIAALLKARDAVLRDAEAPGHADLGKLARFPELAQSHLLGDKLGRARLDFLAPGRA